MTEKTKDCIGRLERYRRQCEAVAIDARGGFQEWCFAYVADLDLVIADMRTGDYTDEHIVQITEQHLKYKIGA